MDSEMIGLIYLMIMGLVGGSMCIPFAYKNRSRLIGVVGYGILGVIVYMGIRLLLNHISLPSVLYLADGIIQLLLSVILALAISLVGVYFLPRIEKEKK